MLQKIKENWEQFKDAEPGHRFQDRYERRHEEGQSSKGTIFNIGLGIIVTLVGLFLIPAPGPGTIILFLGLSLIGAEFLPLARFLDGAEMRVHPTVERVKSVWSSTSLPLKGALGAIALVCAAGVAYGAYQIFVAGSRGS